MPKSKTFYVVGKLHDGEFERKYLKPIERKLMELGLELNEVDPSIVVAVGGDGTLLRAARKYPESEVLGIRVESKGSYSTVDFEEWKEALESIASNDYVTINLSKVELKYKDKKLEGLNEVYFFRDVSKFPGANRFRVFKNGEDAYSDVVYADGCLLATPSGSTAYNWSYFGPIIEFGLVFTPMAGCLLHKTKKIGERIVAEHTGSLVLDGKDEILVEIERDAPNILCADNKILSNINLKRGDKIIFKKSDSFAKLIVPFYKI